MDEMLAYVVRNRHYRQDPINDFISYLAAALCLGLSMISCHEEPTTLSYEGSCRLRTDVFSCPRRSSSDVSHLNSVRCARRTVEGYGRIHRAAQRVDEEGGGELGPVDALHIQTATQLKRSRLAFSRPRLNARVLNSDLLRVKILFD